MQWVRGERKCAEHVCVFVNVRAVLWDAVCDASWCRCPGGIAVVLWDTVCDVSWCRCPWGMAVVLWDTV